MQLPEKLKSILIFRFWGQKATVNCEMEPQRRSAYCDPLFIFASKRADENGIFINEQLYVASCSDFVIQKRRLQLQMQDGEEKGSVVDVRRVIRTVSSALQMLFVGAPRNAQRCSQVSPCALFIEREKYLE